MYKSGLYRAQTPLTDFRICKRLGKSSLFHGRGFVSLKIRGNLDGKSDFTVWGAKEESKGSFGVPKEEICVQDEHCWLGSMRYYVSWLFPLSGMLALQCLELGPWLAVRIL